MIPTFVSAKKQQGERICFVKIVEKKFRIRQSSAIIAERR